MEPIFPKMGIDDIPEIPINPPGGGHIEVNLQKIEDGCEYSISGSEPMTATNLRIEDDHLIMDLKFRGPIDAEIEAFTTCMVLETHPPQVEIWVSRQSPKALDVTPHKAALAINLKSGDKEIENLFKGPVTIQVCQMTEAGRHNLGRYNRKHA